MKVELAEGKLTFSIDSNSGETRPGEIDISPDTDLTAGGTDEPAMAE